MQEVLIYADTDKMIESANLLINQADTFHERVNSIYSKLSNVEEETWTGNSAKAFVNLLSTEKDYYEQFYNVLVQYSDVIAKNAEILNNTIENSRFTG